MNYSVLPVLRYYFTLSFSRDTVICCWIFQIVNDISVHIIHEYVSTVRIGYLSLKHWLSLKVKVIRSCWNFNRSEKLMKNSVINTSQESLKNKGRFPKKELMFNAAHFVHLASVGFFWTFRNHLSYVQYYI